MYYATAFTFLIEEDDEEGFMPDTGVGVALMVLKGADWKVARIFSYDHVDAGK